MLCEKRWVVLLAVCLFTMYRRMRKHSSVLHIKPGDARMQRLCKNTSALKEEYRAPWWCCNTWLNVAVMLIKEKLLEDSVPMRRETLIRPDGGEVSVDYADDESTRALAADAPVLGILHTITGSSGQQAGFMKYATARGWRPCVLNRRGHSGMPLRVPHFSLLGNIDDTVAMVDTIRQQYPDSFIALAGISAGSGQVVSYIGREGDRTAVGAAASLCPAWDISKSFEHLEHRYPSMDFRMTRTVQTFFLARPENMKAFQGMEDVVETVKGARTLNEFISTAAPLAGCKNVEEYFEQNNPMVFAFGNKTPTLVLNALDDFLCVKENIRLDLIEKAENYAVLVTEEGSHIAYTEGMLGGSSYMWRIAMDFFEAALSDSKQG